MSHLATETSPEELLLFLDFETATNLVVDTPVLETAAALYCPQADRVVATGQWLHAVQIHRRGQQVAISVGIDSTQHVLDPAVQQMHTDSGLLAELSDTRNTFADNDIDIALADLIDDNNCDDRPVRLAGIGVAHFDSHIITRVLPRVQARLRPGPGDVSVTCRVLRSFGVRIPQQGPGFGAVAHRARPDVEQGIERYRWLRNTFGPYVSDQRRLAAAG